MTLKSSLPISPPSFHIHNRRHNRSADPYQMDVDPHQYSYVDTPRDRPDADARDADAGYALQLEKDYCTNFTCCGLTLADLHELLGHFEEHHVTVMGPGGSVGLPLYKHEPYQLGDPYPSSALTPQSSNTSSAASSALPSPISPYTPPSPNRFPTLTSAFVPRPSDADDDSALAESDSTTIGREGESAFAPVTVALSGALGLVPNYGDYLSKSYLAKEDASSKEYLPESPLDERDTDKHKEHRPTQYLEGKRKHALDTLLNADTYDYVASPSTSVSASVVPRCTVYEAESTDSTPANPASASNSPHTYPLAPTPVYARHPNLSIITDLPTQGTIAPLQSISRTHPNSHHGHYTPGRNPKKRRAAPASSSKKNQNRREKAHKCPHVGCIKSYLNLNGLKYHLTKGVCDFGEQ
ncbi:hypothetical protein JB92DRAFT_2903939 [Gautieria morchelliformis]|nr:hypothetical protein JB92DRAFT_2903939 [Gautieria morchelliformis]